MLMMAFITCSIITMVTPLSRMRETSSMASPTSVGFRPAIISSSISSLGRVAMARATSTRFWKARVMSFMDLSALSARPTKSSTPRVISSASFSGMRFLPKVAPMSTFW